MVSEATLPTLSLWTVITLVVLAVGCGGTSTSDDRANGAAIQRVEIVPYRHSHTYDILPASDSGAYFAGGVLTGSTLSR